MQYTISYEENPKLEDILILENGIKEYDDKQKKRNNHIVSFAFFMRDENGKIVGGSQGEIMFGHLFISQLWISELLRRKGYGTNLMRATEKLAHDKECHFIAVNTMEWQALDFYKKLGFYIEFERHGFNNNSILYYLRKDL